MAVTFFQYIHRLTWLHEMKGRWKLLCLILLTLSATSSTAWFHFLIIGFVLAAALVVSQLPFFSILKELKWLFILLVIVFFLSGWLLTARLSLMVLISIIMTGTTTPQAINQGITWYLRPIPFVKEVRIATMINLIFNFIPMIFSQYQEMSHAQHARLVGLRKNPVRRIKLLVIPLVGRMLRQADELIFAMEARSYSEVRVKERETLGSKWDFLSVCVSLIIFLFVLFS